MNNKSLYASANDKGGHYETHGVVEFHPEAQVTPK